MVHLFTMMSPPLFLAFFIYTTMLWTPCNTLYTHELQHRQQGKLHWLSRELVTDADMKIKSVQNYRNQYYKSLQYQMGDMIYEMRDFYRKMVEIYQGMDRNISYGDLDFKKNMYDFVRVQALGMQIETQVNMIQVWQNKRETKDEHHERKQGPMLARSGTRLENDESEDVPLREFHVRQRMARRAATAAVALPTRKRGRVLPRAPALGLADKRMNKKWRNVRDDDFARRVI